MTEFAAYIWSGIAMVSPWLIEISIKNFFSYFKFIIYILLIHTIPPGLLLLFTIDPITEIKYIFLINLAVLPMWIWGFKVGKRHYANINKQED